MRAIDVIRRKRNGEELTKEELSCFLRGYTAGEIPDYQAAALLMACFLNGMTERETLVMTEEIVRSGDSIDLSEISLPKIDKHSTGGVGDVCSLSVAPIVAACGVCVPMISGRGLGHTGGTLDKLESIAGYRTALSGAEFTALLKKVGVAVVGQSERMAPADKKLYALRDATGTVESIPLITASIMGKKLSEGIDGLVLDVKTGSGAFMKREEDARALAESMVKIGKAAGKRVVALITDMDCPLGNVVGNSLEVIEAIDMLKGNAPEDYTELCYVLAAHMLTLAGKGDVEACTALAKRAVESGAALRKLKEMVSAQGGDPAWAEDTNLFPQAAYSRAVRAVKTGYITHINTEAYGLAAVQLRAGRNQKEDTVDFAAGIRILKKTGDFIECGEEVAILLAEDEALFAEAEKILLGALSIGARPPEKRRLVIDCVG